MSFVPVVPTTGYSGWLFLKRTMAAQKEAFVNQASLRREESHYRSRIPDVAKAEQLVDDARLLRLSLSAFGLENDAQNKYFVRRILEDGTLSVDALSNRLADKRYREFSKAFGFGDFATPSTKLSDFADKMLARYRNQKFEEAVGEVNSDFRLGLNSERLLSELARGTGSDRAKWFSILGSPPMRQVFEKALGLPAAFASVDLDKQVETLEERTRSVFGEGSVAQFSDSKKVEKLIRLFIVRSEVAAGVGAVSSGQAALTLLQQAAYGRP